MYVIIEVSGKVKYNFNVQNIKKHSEVSYYTYLKLTAECCVLLFIYAYSLPITYTFQVLLSLFDKQQNVSYMDIILCYNIGP